ncbi:MAG: cyclic nucleotide-binding domain-containing protein, partial [Deltaproteobacteria bacterium]|nr:cyclic nucleotide-binding domain-containing protein [Deltaproteobacteria bacterium]
MPEKNLLSGFSFFSDVDPDTQEAISSKGEILEFKAEDIIFRVDEPANHFYGLLEGEVDLVLVFKDKVLKTDIEYEEAIQATMVDEEKEIIVDTVTAGQVFGWASIVGPAKRTVNAECSENSRVISIPAGDLIAMFDKDHTLGFTIMKRLSAIIARRLRNRTDKLIETWGEAF